MSTNKERVNQESLELLALGEMLSGYGGARAALSAMRAGEGKEGFMRRLQEESRKTSLARAADQLLGIDSQKDLGGYSITTAIRACIKKDWTNAGLESSINKIAMDKGLVANGNFYFPLGLAARDFNIGTSTEAGNLMGAPRGPSGLLIDPLRRVSVAASMGATMLSGLRATVTLPTFQSSTQASWLTEIGAATDITETSAAVTLTPKRVSTRMVLSREALFQSSAALDIALSRHMVQACLEQAEYGAFNGDGTNDSPVGIRSTSGITTVAGGANGAQLAFSHLADLENGPSTANAPETDYSGFAVNPSIRRWLRTTARGTNLPFIWEGGDNPLLQHRAAITNILPSNLSKGTSNGVCSSLVYSNDWQALVMGIYGAGLDILVDHITQASIGKVVVTAALHIGVGVIKPSAFSKMDDALTA